MENDRRTKRTKLLLKNAFTELLSMKTLNEISNELMVPVIDIVDQNASIYLLPDQVILYKKEKTI